MTVSRGGGVNKACHVHFVCPLATLNTVRLKIMLSSRSGMCFFMQILCRIRIEYKY